MMPQDLSGLTCPEACKVSMVTERARFALSEYWHGKNGRENVLAIEVSIREFLNDSGFL